MPSVRLERLSPERIEECYNRWANEDKYPMPKDASPEEVKKLVRHLHKVIGWITCLRPDHVLLAIDNETDRVVGSADWIIVNPKIENQLRRPGKSAPCFVPRPPILLNDEGDVLEIHELTIEKDWGNAERHRSVEMMLLDRIVQIARECSRRTVRWYVDEKTAQWIEKAGFSKINKPEDGIWLMTRDLT